MGAFWEVGLGEFLFVTVFLGGSAAYLSGRSVALTWRPIFNVLLYAAGIACAVRFVHYALFGGTLLSLQYAAVDFLFVLAMVGLGFQMTRTALMPRQYPWLFNRQDRSANG